MGESRGFGPRSKESWWWNDSVQIKVWIKGTCVKDWFRCKNSETWDKYKIAKKETKKAVSEARTQVFDGLYQSLCNKEGEKSIHKLANGWERKTRELDQVKCIKDEKGRVLVQERNTKDIWKKYFHNLFNEGYEILPECNMLDIREEGRNYNYYCQILEHGVKETLKGWVMTMQLG